MFTFKKSPPAIPIAQIPISGTASTLPQVERDRIKLWIYFRVLAEVQTVKGVRQSIPVNQIYRHFIDFFGVDSKAITRLQFGHEIHRWIRGGHLPFKVTNPGHGNPVMCEGINETILTAIFQQ